MARIYVASSWRNKYQPEVVAALRAAGHEVYDFRNPKDNPGGFLWYDVDENWQNWEPEEYIKNLTHPVAEKGFKTIVYMPEKQEPELMYKLFDGVVGSLDTLLDNIQ